MVDEHSAFRRDRSEPDEAPGRADAYAPPRIVGLGAAHRLIRGHWGGTWDFPQTPGTSFHITGE
jgi:hypothetical protein